MKRIFALLSAVAVLVLTLGAAAPAGSQKYYSWELSGKTATIRSRDGAELVLENVMKAEEVDGELTIYTLRRVPYRVKADTFVMFLANAGDFNSAPGSKYRIYEMKADGSRGKETGEVLDTAALLDRGIVAMCNPAREQKYWELLPNHSSGTLENLDGWEYVIQLSNEYRFSSQRSDWSHSIRVVPVDGADSSEIASVVKKVSVPGEGVWEYLSNGKRRFYMTLNGYNSYAYGWKQIAGKWYSFSRYNENGMSMGDMMTGWVNEMPEMDHTHGLSWRISGPCFLQEDGSLKTGWVQRDGDWYYLDPETLWYRGGWFRDADSSWYYLHPKTGKMHIGWLWENGKWYYFGENGKMYDNGWRPTQPSMDGVVMLGEWEGFHYFRKDGAMATGWQLIDDEWYYFNPDGSSYNGWLQSGGKWYYLKSGVMQKNRVVGGYQLDKNGVWVP